MFKPVTIKDIAKALNLSPSTVSRALSDSYEINEETKKRVKEYAELHNYRRNPMASSLRLGRSYSIGVVVCEVANSFFSQAIDGIESVAYSKGYHVIISQSHDSYEREVVNIQHLANRAVDGLLISMSAETKDFSHIVNLHSQGLPIVFFDRIIDAFETHTVTANNREGARKATQSLLDRGYKRIAHLANAPHLSITTERLQGYAAALNTSSGLPLDESLIRYCHNGGRVQQEVDDAMSYFLGLREQPDAIFVASDRLSMGSLAACNKLAPANHPAIAGFSNSEVLDLLQPGFTCVRQPAFEMGRVAMESLIHLIESRYPVYDFKHTVLDTELFNSPSSL